MIYYNRSNHDTANKGAVYGHSHHSPAAENPIDLRSPPAGDFLRPGVLGKRRAAELLGQPDHLLRGSHQEKRPLGLRAGLH